MESLGSDSLRVLNSQSRGGASSLLRKFHFSRISIAIFFDHLVAALEADVDSSEGWDQEVCLVDFGDVFLIAVVVLLCPHDVVVKKEREVRALAADAELLVLLYLPESKATSYLRFTYLWRHLAFRVSYL